MFFLHKMFQTASVANFGESFKQAATNKRAELLKILEKKLSTALYEQCNEYFRNQTNLILAETEIEVKAYLKQLENEASQLRLKMGLLCFVPVVQLYAPIGMRRGMEEIQEKKKSKGYGKYVSFSQEETALTKYEPGSIEVSLCFGTVTIPLLSKITIGRSAN